MPFSQTSPPKISKFEKGPANVEEKDRAFNSPPCLSLHCPKESNQKNRKTNKAVTSQRVQKAQNVIYRKPQGHLRNSILTSNPRVGLGK